MATEDGKALVREWLQAVDTGDVGVVDNYLGGGFVDHNPPPFQGPNTGVQGAKDAFTYALGAFSDFRHEIEEQFVDGDRVISRIKGYGKHTGEFLGIPPTGREVQMEGIAIHRVVDGRLVEHWAQVDAAGLLIQLGAIAAPGESPPS
jgi:predicted ester cyclase